MVRVDVQVLLAPAHPVVVDVLRHEERRGVLLSEARLEGSCVDVGLSVERQEARLAWRDVVEALAVNTVVVFCREGHGGVEGIRMVRHDGLRLGVAVALVGGHGDGWLGRVETGGLPRRLQRAELRNVMMRHNAWLRLLRRRGCLRVALVRALRYCRRQVGLMTAAVALGIGSRQPVARMSRREPRLEPRKLRVDLTAHC